MPQARPGIKREKKDGAERGGGMGGLRMKVGQQRHGDERPQNSSHRVSGALKPERLAARFRRNRIRQDGVARRAANSPPEPSQGARKQNQRPAGSQRKQRGGTSGDEVSAHGYGLAAPGAVGKPSGTQLDETRNAVRHALDQSQGGGGNSQSGEEAGQHGGGHLMADVGKQAGEPHAHHVAIEPGCGLLFGGLRAAHGCRRTRDGTGGSAMASSSPPGGGGRFTWRNDTE